MQEIDDFCEVCVVYLQSMVFIEMVWVDYELCARLGSCRLPSCCPYMCISAYIAPYGYQTRLVPLVVALAKQNQQPSNSCVHVPCPI